MTGRRDVIEFLQESARRMHELAGSGRVPQHIAGELRRIALDLGAEAAGIEAELSAQHLLSTTRNGQRF